MFHFHLALRLPLSTSPPPKATVADDDVVCEADDEAARHEMDWLSLSCDDESLTHAPGGLRANAEAARHEMDRLSLSCDPDAVADPWGDLDFLSLSPRRR
jgi:hypothetical protein